MQIVRLYIANFDYSTTDQELKELFSFYGKVKDVKIVEGKEGKNTGFVEMTCLSEAEKAKKALNGTFFKGSPLKILM